MSLYSSCFCEWSDLSNHSLPSPSPVWHADKHSPSSICLSFFLVFIPSSSALLLRRYQPLRSMLAGVPLLRSEFRGGRGWIVWPLLPGDKEVFRELSVYNKLFKRAWLVGRPPRDFFLIMQRSNAGFRHNLLLICILVAFELRLVRMVTWAKKRFSSKITFAFVLAQNRTIQQLI